MQKMEGGAGIVAIGEGQGQTSKKGGGKGLIIGGGVVIVALCVIIAILLLKPQDEARDKRETISEENVEKVVEKLTDTPENIPQNYTVTQNANWEFPDGKSESTNSYVENDKENTTPVYFDIVVDDTGETVYSSPVLELGAKLEHIKLDKELEKGQYGCTMTYHLVDEEQNTLTTVEVGLNLIIQN